MRIVIVGGNAGGVSAAARLRRLNEKAEIIILERGGYVSFANCGLPYYIGGVIQEKSALSVQTPESLHARFALDVRTKHEVIRLDADKKEIAVRNLDTMEEYTLSFDRLILAPGAAPVRPGLSGLEDPRVFTLRDIPDTYRIDDFIREKKPKRALVVGAGYVGLELAENLVQAGLHVTVAELSDHIIAPLDAEMAAGAQQYLRQRGVQLLLQNGLTGVKPGPEALEVSLTGTTVQTDMLLLGIGVKPESGLAKDAGLQLNARGAIVVDSRMRTSSKDIYAVGDAVEVTNAVTGKKAHIPLAGPANRQGRIAADNIMGIPRRYAGTQGTSIVKIFGFTVGSTGVNETTAKQAGLAYDKVYLTPLSHAGYYPGALPMTMKVLFERGTGRILGAQIAGYEGVDKRLDLLAVAVRQRLTAEDLVDFELSYAPPYSSAKDPVNMAGFMIQNLLEERVFQFHWDEAEVLIQEGAQLIDVRTPEEYVAGHMEGAVSIPLDTLRENLSRIDRNKPVYLYCHSGTRSYYGARLLMENGFSEVRHLAGGFGFYDTVREERRRLSSVSSEEKREMPENQREPALV